MKDHFDTNEYLKGIIGAAMGQDPLIKDDMVTLAYSPAPDQPFYIVAVFESKDTAELFIRSTIPEERRWQYRISLDKKVMIL